MNDKTLKELRVQAKARGLKGYATLSKDELLRQLNRQKSATAAASTGKLAPARRKSARVKVAAPKKSVAARKPPSARTVTPPESERAVSAPSPQATPGNDVQLINAEERVEDAKYVLRPQGAPMPPMPVDLGEDIDRLPALPESTVCLLPQKPGILHAYWLLPPGETARRGEYKLRLCRTANNALEVYDEVTVHLDRGSHYFHVPEDVGDQELLVQLGYYHAGEFISAQGRGIARPPNLYASTHTDNRWWVSPEEFERMYVRAGGVVTAAHRPRWSASVGSPVGAPEQRMSWPGSNVSSRSA